MRLIGHVQDETQADRLTHFLYGRGIESRADPADDGRWEIWVLDDNDIETAKTLLEQFSQRPDDPMFIQSAREAARQKDRDQARQKPKRARVVDARTIFYMPPVPFGALSIILIVIAVAVTVMTRVFKNEDLFWILAISEYVFQDWSTFLPEVRHGQVWRLFTPMFLHFGPLHLLFNVLWMRDLGSMIEARKSSWMLLLLTLVLAAASNVGQYLMSGPGFGGLSGVVYGLLGYVWMQGKFNPASGLSLQPQTVTMMIAWFFLCLTGIIGPIANTAHAVGLGAGIAWGYLGARWAVWKRHH